jgi:hypothetical protein
VKKRCFVNAFTPRVATYLFPPGRFDPEGIHGALWAELDDTSFRLPKERRLPLAAEPVAVAMRKSSTAAPPTPRSAWG